MEDWIKRIYWFYDRVPGDEFVILNGRIWTKAFIHHAHLHEITPIQDFIDKKQDEIRNSR